MNNELNALVMFSDSSSNFILKLLRPKFRHCFIAVQINNDWVVYEPLLKRTELSIIENASSSSVEKCFKVMGCIVVKTKLNRTKAINRNLLSPFTCTEAVSRVLGINSKGVYTPFQLYKKLIKDY